MSSRLGFYNDGAVDTHYPASSYEVGQVGGIYLLQSTHSKTLTCREVTASPEIKLKYFTYVGTILKIGCTHTSFLLMLPKQ